MTENIDIKQGFQFAPNIKARHQAQEEAMRVVRKQGERDYISVRGDYSEGDHRVLLVSCDEDLVRKATSVDVESLTGFEIFLQRTIDKLLLLKKNGDPVVILDIGSMVGLSWHRLANHYKDKVKEGKLAFVASSLAYEPDREKETAPKLRKDFLSKEERLFLEESKDLVKHIQATPSQLRRRQINLPNGRRIPLEHHVDLAYEEFSITAWSKVPDIDILRIPALLSEIGMYFVTKVDVSVIQGYTSTGEQQERIDGIKLAHEQLKSKYGLIEVRSVEEGELKGEPLNNFVFRKHNAPAIIVDDGTS